ncbi:MAG: hypothetical protein KDB74_06650 [Flavobacteriales bacterium]|nr:hypothetical protein [Flavobacteriales bacterium]
MKKLIILITLFVVPVIAQSEMDCRCEDVNLNGYFVSSRESILNTLAFVVECVDNGKATQEQFQPIVTMTTERVEFFRDVEHNCTCKGLTEKLCFYTEKFKTALLSILETCEGK